MAYLILQKLLNRILTQNIQMQIQKHSKYNGFTTKGGNYVWGAALGLAWYQLIDKFVKQNIKINSSSKQALNIVDNFNNCKFTVKDIDDRCVYIKSGYGQDTVKTINTQSKKKFPQKSFGDLNIQLGPQDIISYAYLLKKLEFQAKFERRKQPSFLFEDKKVDSFYADKKEQKKQLHYFYYKSQDQFMITIDTKKPNDQIYFIKDKSVQNVDEAISKVQEYESKVRHEVVKQDFFEMPVVELDVKRDVQQLIGKMIKNKNLANYMFAAVYEGIKLKIDEAGAKVQNQAVIFLKKCKIVQKKVQPKHFILNKQFWVVMKQKGKHPYFCALIKQPTDI